MVSVSLHYWAGAKAAAGVAEEQIEARSVAEPCELVCRQRSDATLRQRDQGRSVLIDGAYRHRKDLEQPLSEPVQVEVLPPFAGGS